MVNTERDPESGKLAEQYSDDDFLDAVEANTPASTSEVAEAVGCSRRNAEVRLKRLEEAGEVRSKMVGNSLSWLPVE
jgi:predicted transcriptional regulator